MQNELHYFFYSLVYLTTSNYTHWLSEWV